MRYQRYLGINYDSTRAFRVPQDELHKLHAITRVALAAGGTHDVTLEEVVGKAISMSVAVELRFCGLTTCTNDTLKKNARP